MQSSIQFFQSNNLEEEEEEEEGKEIGLSVVYPPLYGSEREW